MMSACSPIDHLVQNTYTSVIQLMQQIASAQIETNFTWPELRMNLISILMEIAPNNLVRCDDKREMILSKCIDRLEYLTEIPFTIQRICELVLMLDAFLTNDNTNQYKNFEKYLNALYKCLNVTGKCDDTKLLPNNPTKMDTSL